MAEFSFYAYKDDIAHLDYIFNQWDNITDNDTIRSAFTAVGLLLKYELRQGARDAHMATFGHFYDPSKHSFNIYRPSGFSYRYSKKKNDIREYVGSVRPAGNAMHLLDKGTADRYTKRGYYRGHISKVLGAHHGHGGYTNVVETEGPQAMQLIAGAIEAALYQVK